MGSDKIEIKLLKMKLQTAKNSAVDFVTHKGGLENTILHIRGLRHFQCFDFRMFVYCKRLVIFTDHQHVLHRFSCLQTF